jgi:hypothetical protein
MKNKIRSFGHFWYDFVVGDEWTVAAGAVAALALTYLLSRTGSSSWWILPAAVAFLLPWSVWRAARRRRSSAG